MVARLAIIGSRGIPAKYGGFEVFTEHLATRLAEKGYSVIVGCEYPDGEMINKYKGVILYYFPFSPPKSYFLRKFYEIFNDIYFMAKLSRSCNLLYILGTGSGLFMFIPKLLNKKIKVMLNVDGLEWKRGKFNKLEKMLLKFNFWLATVFADVVVIDAKVLKNYLNKSCWGKTVFIPYGADPQSGVSWDKSKWEELSSRCSKINNINQNDYWLVVARLEPENNIHTILEGFLKSSSKKPLVVVGDYTSKRYSKRLSSILEKDNEGRIQILGAIYDKELIYTLRRNSLAYIHGHSVGGTNPSLLEAMIAKNIIISHDNEFNREVCNDFALYFNDANDLKNKIELIEKNPDSYPYIKEGVYNIAINQYSWDKVVDDYGSAFSSLMG